MLTFFDEQAVASSSLLKPCILDHASVRLRSWDAMAINSKPAVVDGKKLAVRIGTFADQGRHLPSMQAVDVPES